MISQEEAEELLRLKADGGLFHRESQTLEFKEQFNFAGLADYFRDFAAFANNRGGHLVFGVSDSPRLPTGLNPGALDQLSKLDPEKISGMLLDLFDPAIEWDCRVMTVHGKAFGIFKIAEAHEKPVIAKKNEGRDQTIKNGEVYYRYGGRTQTIKYGELAGIIRRRVEANNRDWLDLMEKIGKVGPANAAVLDLDRPSIAKHEKEILVVDEDLAKKLTFVKEGSFSETAGAPTLKLVGDVVPVDRIEVVRQVREHLVRRYPLSAMELARAVKDARPNTGINEVWDVIGDHDLKTNPDYSAYNFRNKAQQDHYEETGYVPAATPSIYNQDAVEYIIAVLDGTR